MSEEQKIAEKLIRYSPAMSWNGNGFSVSIIHPENLEEVLHGSTMLEALQNAQKAVNNE